MKTRWSYSTALAIAVTVLIGLSPVRGVAQGGGAPSGQTPGQPPAGSRPPSSAPSPNRIPGQLPDTSSRMLYISGRVLLADGTPPPSAVAIERVCNGMVRPESYTDSRGYFSFQLGGQNAAFYDASTGADPLSADTTFGNLSAPRGVSEREVIGCEIRAKLAGFESDVIPLGFRRSLDDPDIGIIHIRPLERVEGFTYSVTSDAAPKDARKAHENAMNHIRRQKWTDAEKELTKAVQQYPPFALAWYDLGRVYYQQKKLDDARRAYEQALEADPKFINPYGQLAILAVGEQNWRQVADYTGRMLQLNPYVTADIYFYSAVANYNLQDFDRAERLARQASEIDSEHRMVRINHFLGTLLAEKGDYKGAVDNLRIYLKFTPQAPDAAEVEKRLAELELELQR